MFSRAWPHSEFLTATRYQTVVAYVFHFATLGVVIGIVPHIEFIHSVIGLSWPALPNAIGVGLGAIALLSLIALVLRRLGNRTVYCSTWDDYATWLVVAAPLLTGLVAFTHFDIGLPYETLLAIHILSAELLFLWFPFSKLMHAYWFVFSRAQSGVAYSSRGVRI